jgi:hypothetical protein
MIHLSKKIPMLLFPTLLFLKFFIKQHNANKVFFVHFLNTSFILIPLTCIFMISRLIFKIFLKYFYILPIFLKIQH